MKTLTILFLLAATQMTFAIQQDLADCNGGTADNVYEVSPVSESTSTQSSVVGF